jgi:hypothetical protein
MQLCREWPFTDDKGLYGRFHFNLHLSMYPAPSFYYIRVDNNTSQANLSYIKSIDSLFIIMSPRLYKYILICWDSRRHFACSLCGSTTDGSCCCPRGSIYTGQRRRIGIYTSGFIYLYSCAEVNARFYGERNSRGGQLNFRVNKIWANAETLSGQEFQ